MSHPRTLPSSPACRRRGGLHPACQRHAVALHPILMASGGTWVAHGSGSADRSMVDANDCVMVPPGAPGYKLRRVWLNREVERGFYYGLSNEGLWPLCHITPPSPPVFPCQRGRKGYFPA